MDNRPARERLHDLFADHERAVEAQVQAALELGATELGLSIGFRSRIEDGVQRIVQATGDHPLIQPGETCPLDDAYCRRTVELDSPLALQDVDGSGAISQSAVETFGLGSYIGARVVVEGETHGTVCFADEECRDAPFGDAESHFVELLAKLTGQAIERRSYRRELAAREADLEERAEVYRAVIDASFDLVFRIDPDGEFSFISQGVEPLLGYDDAAFLGSEFTAVVPDEAVEDGRALFERVLGGETVEDEYFPVEHRDGETVFVDVRMTPIYEAGSGPADRSPATVVGVQGTARDATERFRREQLIRVMNRVLRHNLRNDMNVVSGLAALLEERLDGEAAGLAGRIRRTSDRLVDLSETARDLEQIWESPPEPEPIDVVPLAEETVAQVAERHPAASMRLQAPDAAVATCAPSLETALWELLDNAARHAGDEPSVDLSVRANDGAVVVAVADDGPGLPEQERTVLLDGEETPLVHGSGLGLWLVHWIVESVGGDIRLAEAGPGTTVEVWLDAADD